MCRIRHSFFLTGMLEDCYENQRNNRRIRQHFCFNNSTIRQLFRPDNSTVLLFGDFKLYPEKWTVNFIAESRSVDTFFHSSVQPLSQVGQFFYQLHLGGLVTALFISWVDLSYHLGDDRTHLISSFFEVGGHFITPFASWVDLSYHLGGRLHPLTSILSSFSKSSGCI